MLQTILSRKVSGCCRSNVLGRLALDYFLMEIVPVLNKTIEACKSLLLVSITEKDRHPPKSVFSISKLLTHKSVHLFSSVFMILLHVLILTFISDFIFIHTWFI